MSGLLTFVKSAAKLADFPIDHKNEVAFAGRSNAGKSSVINTLSRGKVAMVSSTPGKTRLLNLFDHREGYRLVDMPGYGYAARGGDEIKSWQNMIETFLFQRENLKAIVLIMDIRRDWDEEEQMLLKLAQRKGLHFGVVLNKADKLSRGAAKARKEKVLQGLNVEFSLLYSASEKIGVQDLENQLFDWLKS